MASIEKNRIEEDNQGSGFTALQEFAFYVLENKLPEVTKLNIEMARDLKLPLLSLFEHLPEEELFALFYKGQRDFFEQVTEGTAFQKARESLYKWKENKLEGIPRNEVKVVDLVMAYSLRKQVALKILPSFSTDCEVLIPIIQELERFHVELERIAFDIYVEIQNEELQTKNQFLSSLIENSVDGIVAVDVDLNVKEWNPELESIFNIYKKDIVGRPLVNFFPALASAPIYRAFKSALKGNHVHLEKANYSSRAGYYEANVVPLYNEKNLISGAFGVIHDISHHTEAEDRLKEHREELQTANEELREQREELQAANEELTQQREETEEVNEELQESLAQLRETREALERAVNQLEEAQETAHLGSFEYFPETDHIEWSAEMKEIFGYGKEDRPPGYKDYLEMIHPDDREMIRTEVAKCIEKNKPYAFEHRIINKSGKHRWLLAHGKGVFNNGKLQKLHGTGMDITERKIADIKLQEEQYFIRKVTDTTPDLITVFDLEKRVNVYANRELETVLGYDKEEIEALRADPAFLQKLVHPEDLERGLNFVMDFRKHTTDTGSGEIEYRLCTKSGEYIWVAARYNVFRRDANGIPVQLIGITRNIHDRKLAEEEIKKTNFKLHETNEELVRTEELLKEANNELEEQVARRTAELQRKNAQLIRINSDLDNFIYTASHDLKVPIVNLEGLLILINKNIQDKLPEKEKNLLNMMHTSIERFKKTIEDLSDVTKMQKDLDDEVKEIIQFPVVFEDVRNDIEQLILENKASISCSFEVQEVAFDRKNMRSILFNFLTNAIKYRSRERNPQVSIKTSKVKNGVLLSISDNGEGIPENQYEKIFSLFKRLNKAVEGSGMGLYIVKRIIDNHGGSIEVKSEIGKGTTFNIYLQNGKETDNHTIG